MKIKLVKNQLAQSSCKYDEMIISECYNRFDVFWTD